MFRGVSSFRSSSLFCTCTSFLWMYCAYVRVKSACRLECLSVNSVCCGPACVACDTRVIRETYSVVWILLRNRRGRFPRQLEYLSAENAQRYVHVLAVCTHIILSKSVCSPVLFFLYCLQTAKPCLVKEPLGSH